MGTIQISMSMLFLYIIFYCSGASESQYDSKLEPVLAPEDKAVEESIIKEWLTNLKDIPNPLIPNVPRREAYRRSQKHYVRFGKRVLEDMEESRVPGEELLDWRKPLHVWRALGGSHRVPVYLDDTDVPTSKRKDTDYIRFGRSMKRPEERDYVRFGK